jgi:hypothetical protein
MAVGPFSDMHLYLQWGGKLYTGQEGWSCGIRLIKKGGGPWTSLDPTALIASAVTCVQNYHVRAGSMISSQAKLSFVKLNAIGTDGRYIELTTTQQIVADVPGGTATNAHPPQCALAVTLESGFSRGPAHRGRFFSPMPAVAMGTDGMISTTDRTAIKTSAELLRTDLNTLSTAWQVGICSRKLGAPTSRACTGVSIGRVVDTQRRRRRSLLELY